MVTAATGGPNARAMPQHAYKPWSPPSTNTDDDSLSHWVKLAFTTMRREMDVSLRAAGMTVTQWRALGVLYHNPDATQSDLMKQLEIEAPSVTSLVKGMERKGWVSRERSSTDARVKRLHLTPQGRRVIQTAGRACAPVRHRMEESLPARERAALKSLLRTMIDRMH